MSYAYSRNYSSSPTSSLPSKKPSRLKDNSWIRKDEEEDEDVDRDPNFGKSILGRYSKTIETNERFSASQDELNKTSTSPTSYGQKTTSYTRSSTSSLRSPTSSTSTVTERPKTSTTTTTFTENGKTTETTTSRSGTFTDRVFSDGKSSFKGAPYSSLLPSSTKVTETAITSSTGVEDPYLDALTSDSKTMTVKSGTDGNTYTTTRTRTSSSAEDKLYDSLIPSIKSDPSSSVSTSVTRTSVVTVESPKVDVFPSTTTTNTYSTTEDKLYDTLLPRSMFDLSSPTSTTSITRKEVKTVESPISDMYNSYSPTYSSRPDSSDKYNSYSTTYSSRPDSSYEYTTITSPSVYTTTSTQYKDNRMADYVDGGDYTSKSSIKTVYSAPERAVLEKDLCSYCRKPFNSEAKMVLDDMKIKCHASCFKCEVCSNTLGNLKAGDSLWIYRSTVHCERCFDVTREKWHR